jgi:hypothetical protein
MRTPRSPLPSRTRAAVCAFVAACALAGRVAAQAAPRAVPLGPPTATLDHEFSQVRGVRELPDGRVLVTDRLEERLYVASFTTGALVSISRPGRGPLEFHLPTALIPFTGDSTLLLDEGNSRLAVIGPDLRIHRSFTLRLPGIGFPLGTRGVDAQGRFYVQIPGWISNARERADSVWLVRFDPARARVDTLASLKGSTSPPQRDGRQLGIPFVPFAPQDNWMVARDGRVALVRSTPYHVEWRAADGRRTRGATVAHSPIRVTMDDRVAFTRSFIANSPIGGRDPNGGMSAAPAELLTDRSIREVAQRNAFADVMGPFTAAVPFVDAADLLWVERTVSAGTSGEWDVFDASGRLVRRVAIPVGRRLVGVGRGTLYLVAADEDGIERLERYASR